MANNIIGSSNSPGERSTTTETIVRNFDPKAQASLDALIASLSSGGTREQKKANAAREEEVGNLDKIREQYSKDAAFKDAQGLMAQQVRFALEKLLPSINTGALGAGASQSSMRALLLQRLAENAAQNAQASGLDAAVKYGNIANGVAQALSNLLNHDDPTARALVDALNMAKGGTVQTSNTVTERDALRDKQAASTRSMGLSNDKTQETWFTDPANMMPAVASNPWTVTMAGGGGGGGGSGIGSSGGGTSAANLPINRDYGKGFVGGPTITPEQEARNYSLVQERNAWNDILTSLGNANLSSSPSWTPAPEKRYPS